MRSPLDSWFNFRSLPTGRVLVVMAIATLLAAADWLPDNPYVDPDTLELWLTVALAGSAIVMTLADRMDREAVAAVRNRLILLAVTFALLATGAEFTTRYIFRSVTTSSDFGGYFSRRWSRMEVVSLNHGGFRGREYSDAKPAGVFRIAAVGDSFTYGNGIPEKTRYSDVLQAQLPSHFEVLNFGRPGANTPEHRTLVEELLPKIHPDFILLQWYINDVEGDISEGRPTFRPLIPYVPLHNFLNSESAFYTVATMQWAETQVALGMTTSYADYLKRRFADPNSRDSKLDRAELEKLIAAADQQHVPVGIVLFPDTAAPIDEHYPFGYLHDRVLDVCAIHKLTCLDLRADFAQIKDRETLWANRLDHHPSARANAIAAERILSTFSPIWAK